MERECEVADLDLAGVVDLAAVLAELAADPAADVATGAILALSTLVERATSIEFARVELVASPAWS